MEKFITKEITAKQEWDEYVLSCQPKAFLQSWNWGESHKLMSEKIIRLGFYDNHRLLGVCLMIKQTAKRGPHILIPGGPLIDWGNEKLVNFVFQEIKNLARLEGVWFVRVRPELVSNNKNKSIFKKLGFVNAPMHLNAENTWILDIDRSEEELLAQMRKTTRYLIKKSLKEDYQLEITQDISKVSTLFKLQTETVQRHKFIGFSKKLFEVELKSFGKDGQADLYICKKDKKAVAAAIIIYYGDTAYYHHSGSTGKYPKLSFSYFLQWNIILNTKSKGLKYYNFWGVAPDDNPKHRFAGVTIFKKGFGGEQTDWLHAQDLPVSLLYWLTYMFENIRKKIRHL